MFPLPLKPSLRAVAASLLISVSAAALQATDGTFNQTTAGTYSWDTAGNWTPGNIADGSGFTATFTSGTTGNQVIALNTDRTIGALVFGSHAWGISGPNKLTLAGSSTPTIAASTQGVTISAVIDGTQGFTNNAGSLILSGSNTYTGTTTVSTTSTVLTLANNNALGATGTNNETIVTSGAAILLNNTIKISDETLTLTGAGGSNSPGALRAADGATGEWAGLIKLNGSVRVAGGTTTNTTAILKLSGVISNGASTGNLLITGGGTTVISAANTYTGSTQIVRGSLKLDGGNNRLPTGTVLDVWGAQAADAAVFDLNGYDQTLAGLTHTSGSGTALVTNSASGALSALTVNVTGSTSQTYGGNITGNIALIKDGTGTQLLTGANTFTGGISVQAGTLSINSAFINDTANVSLVTGSVFDLNFSGTDTIGALLFDGVAQALGTYGSISSTATYKSSFFTGAGILNVTSLAAIPEPSTFAALAGVLILGICALRRRRS